MSQLTQGRAYLFLVVFLYRVVARIILWYRNYTAENSCEHIARLQAIFSSPLFY